VLFSTEPIVDVLPINLERPQGEREVNARAIAPSLDDSLLRSFVEALPDPCVVIDGAGRVLAVNRAWRELPRRNEATFAASNPVGIDYLALFQSSTADDGVSRALIGIKAVLSGQREHFEHEYIRPMPPTFRWFRMTVHAWRELGTNAIIFHRDITAEKFGRLTPQTVDQEFRSLADSAPVMIWMSGPDKECIFVSRHWLEFTGGRIEDALGEGWPQFVHPDDRNALLKAFHTAFDQEREFAHEYRLRHKDGSYRWVRDRGSPRFDAQNRLSGFTGSVWDLSEQKQATEEAHRATRDSRLVQEVAVIANSATTMREALQRSIDVICETMRFPVGHALLINDDEPELAKSTHIVYVRDPERFATLFEMSGRMTWPTDLGAPGEVLRSGRPLFTDVLANTKFPERYPRSQASYDAGLRGGVHLPILVDDKVEAIIEFGSEDLIASDQDVIDTLMAAGERLSRFFERRRAQIKFLMQKDELQASAERLFAMAGRLVDSQEEERRRIAREIHDDFTQRLALVSVKIGNLAGRDRATTLGEMDAGLEDVRESIVAVAGDLRDLSHQLHPTMLALLGLVRALRALCEEFQRARGIETVFELSASDQDASEQAAICLYRVLQESLMNVAKHSDSASVRVSLVRQADQLEMRIRDEGRGFDPDADGRQGIGLVNIEERVRLLNGKLIVNSNPGAGTEIVVQVPAVPLTQQEPD
jgi:PAS domain S-box-containing protein